MKDILNKKWYNRSDSDKCDEENKSRYKREWRAATIFLFGVLAGLQSRWCFKRDLKEETAGRMNSSGEVYAWQRAWPLQRSWGRCLFQSVKYRKGRQCLVGEWERWRAMRDRVRECWATKWPPCWSNFKSQMSLVHTMYLYTLLIWLQRHPMNCYHLLVEFWPLYY